MEVSEDVKRLIIKAGNLLRISRGLPPEKNISKVYEETMIELGVNLGMVRNEKQLIRTPGVPAVIGDDPDNSPGVRFPTVPLLACPKCREMSVRVLPICGSCKDREGGKFRSSLSCRKKECGWKERSERSYPSWLDEYVPDWQGGFKKEVMTDEGIKEV